jgi:hypothetical protein
MPQAGQEVPACGIVTRCSGSFEGATLTRHTRALRSEGEFGLAVVNHPGAVVSSQLHDSSVVNEVGRPDREISLFPDGPCLRRGVGYLTPRIGGWWKVSPKAFSLAPTRSR